MDTFTSTIAGKAVDVSFGGVGKHVVYDDFRSIGMCGGFLSLFSIT